MRRFRYLPFDTDVESKIADLRDLADSTAIVVSNPEHLYATYELANPEAFIQRDMAAVMSREVRAEALSSRKLRRTHVKLEWSFTMLEGQN